MSGVNNPFAPTPASVVQSTANRFPDISNDPALQQPQQQQGYGQQQQQPPSQAGYYGQQQQSGYLQSQPTGYVPQQATSVGGVGGGYPTSSSYASSQTGFLAPSQTSYQQGGYNNEQQQSASLYGNPGSQQQQQQQQQQGPYASPQVSFSVSDLDPYSQLGTLHQSQQAQRPQQPPQTMGYGMGIGSDGNRTLPSNLANVQQVQSHPRQFVQDNKTILMMWDDYAWKQLLSGLDALREGWEARKSAVQQVALQGADPTAVEQLRKEADNFIDSIHASKFQLAEVKDTWRHSTDAASKARVREALNAGLNSLPEYPAPLSPEQLGGAFYRRAAEEYRKQSILSGYQQPQMTGYPQQQQYGLQSQPTGFYPQQQQQQPTGYMQQQPTGYYGGHPGQQQQYY